MLFKLKGTRGDPQDKHFCCVPCTTCKIFTKNVKSSIISLV